MSDAIIHDTSDVSEKAMIGRGTKVWNWAQIREFGKRRVMQIRINRCFH